MKNALAPLIIGSILLTGPLHAADQSSSSSLGKNDADTGASTRAWLKEQAEGINRGETEPYRAESAGKAYRVYVDSIGQKDQQAPESLVSTIKNN